MRFLGREQELSALEREYKRDGGFVVVYGRRRVGKTTLIKEFIKEKMRCISLQMRKATARTSTNSRKRSRISHSSRILQAAVWKAGRAHSVCLRHINRRRKRCLPSTNFSILSA